MHEKDVPRQRNRRFLCLRDAKRPQYYFNGSPQSTAANPLGTDRVRQPNQPKRKETNPGRHSDRFRTRQREFSWGPGAEPQGSEAPGLQQQPA